MPYSNIEKISVNMCMHLTLLTCLKAKIIGRKAIMPKIAKKDIIVYKGLLFNMKSPFRTSQPWEVGVDYHTSMQNSPYELLSNRLSLKIESGYFSFKNLRNCKIYFDNFEFSHRIRFFKCIVKKGSRYYKGRDGEIASENLKLVKEVF